MRDKDYKELRVRCREDKDYRKLRVRGKEDKRLQRAQSQVVEWIKITESSESEAEG